MGRPESTKIHTLPYQKQHSNSCSSTCLNHTRGIRANRAMIILTNVLKMLQRATSLRCWLYSPFFLHTCKLRKPRALTSDCFHSLSYVQYLIKFVPTCIFIKKKQPQNYRSINLNEVSTKILENISKPLVCTQNLTQMQLTTYIDSRIHYLFSLSLQKLDNCPCK